MRQMETGEQVSALLRETKKGPLGGLRFYPTCLDNEARRILKNLDKPG